MKIITLLILILSVVCGCKKESSSTSLNLNNEIDIVNKILVCRNNNFQNKYLTKCDDLVMAFDSTTNEFNTIIDMFYDSNNFDEIVETAEFVGHYYKAIFLDKNNKVISGVTLGCHKVYYKNEYNIYKIIPSSKCLHYEEDLLNYIISNDEGYEEMINKMKDFDIRSILSDKENNF